MKAAQTNRDAVQAGGRSPLSFGATAGAQGIEGSAYQHGGSLGVTLNIPLFTCFSTTYKVRAAEAQADAQAARRDRVSLQVALERYAAGEGIFFGFYPAKKAPQLDPIESLRYQ